jgi:hypothetical protein
LWDATNSAADFRTRGPQCECYLLRTPAVIGVGK